MKVLGWIVIDRATGEWVLRCTSREEARELARTCDGIVGKVVRVR
jgi:hypothetical protein